MTNNYGMICWSFLFSGIVFIISGTLKMRLQVNRLKNFGVTNIDEIVLDCDGEN